MFHYLKYPRASNQTKMKLNFHFSDVFERIDKHSSGKHLDQYGQRQSGQEERLRRRLYQEVDLQLAQRNCRSFGSYTEFGKFPFTLAVGFLIICPVDS